MVFSAGIAVLGAARLFTRVRGGYLLLGLGLGLGALVRPHVSLLLFAALAIGFLVGRRDSRRIPGQFSLAGITKVIGIVVLLVAGSVLAPATARFLKVDSLNSDGVSHRHHRHPGPDQRGQLGVPAGQPELADRLPRGGRHRAVPPAARRGRRRRRPGHAASRGWPCSALLAVGWRRSWTALRRLRSSPYITMAVAYIAMFTYAFAAIANFGILTRERVQLLPDAVHRAGPAAEPAGHRRAGRGHHRDRPASEPASAGDRPRRAGAGPWSRRPPPTACPAPRRCRPARAGRRGDWAERLALAERQRVLGLLAAAVAADPAYELDADERARARRSCTSSGACTTCGSSVGCSTPPTCSTPPPSRSPCSRARPWPTAGTRGPPTGSSPTSTCSCRRDRLADATPSSAAGLDADAGAGRAARRLRRALRQGVAAADRADPRRTPGLRDRRAPDAGGRRAGPDHPARRAVRRPRLGHARWSDRCPPSGWSRPSWPPASRPPSPTSRRGCRPRRDVVQLAACRRRSTSPPRSPPPSAGRPGPWWPRRSPGPGATLDPGASSGPDLVAWAEAYRPTPPRAAAAGLAPHRPATSTGASWPPSSCCPASSPGRAT